MPGTKISWGQIIAVFALVLAGICRRRSGPPMHWPIRASLDNPGSWLVTGPSTLLPPSSGGGSASMLIVSMITSLIPRGYEGATEK